jgi:hypothetical protein
MPAVVMVTRRSRRSPCSPPQPELCDPGRPGSGELRRSPPLARPISRVFPSRDREAVFAVAVGSNFDNNAVTLAGRIADDQAGWRVGGSGHGASRGLIVSSLSAAYVYRMTELPGIFAVSCYDGKHWVAVWPSGRPHDRRFDRQSMRAVDCEALVAASDEIAPLPPTISSVRARRRGVTVV